jgi:peptidyl-prolyl cis-trans isomerase D
MKITKTGRTGKIIIFIFAVAIIFGFAFTGMQAGGGGADSVAVVDGNPVKFADYQRELQAQMDRYSQAFGGKPLTAQQMKLFRVKDQVLERLIEKAIWENTAEMMNIKVGSDEIKTIIKELPYFQRDNEFDVNLYRNLLRANRLTPQMFEEQITKDNTVQKTFDIMRSMSISKNFAKDMLKFKNMGATAHAVRIEKNDVSSFIKITKKEIDTLLGDKTKEPMLKALYNSLSAEYNKPEEVKARHILVKDPKNGLEKAKALRKKVTTKNFAKIAGKETEDPSGKGSKGGDLGWFSRGKMVPAFEKTAFSLKPGSISQPVKSQFGYHIIYVEKKKAAVNKSFEKVKKEVAKKHLQKTSLEKKNKLFDSVVNQVTIALKENRMSKLKDLVKKYDLEFFENTKINLYDQRIGSITLDAKDVEKLFNKEKSVDFIEKPQGAAKALVAISKRNTSKEFAKLVKDKLNEEVTKESEAFRNSLSSEVTNYIKSKSTIVKHDRLL